MAGSCCYGGRGVRQREDVGKGECVYGRIVMRAARQGCGGEGRRGEGVSR
jgi:hypothetical protein